MIKIELVRFEVEDIITASVIEAPEVTPCDCVANAGGTNCQVVGSMHYYTVNGTTYTCNGPHTH